MTDPAAAAGPLRVLLVDTDDRVRESLAGLLRIGHRCLVVGTAGSAADALRRASETSPDVVVIDPRLPGSDGAPGFIARLREAVPAARILVLTWSENGDETMGADAYVRKTFRSHELIAAVLSTCGRPVA